MQYEAKVALKGMIAIVIVMSEAAKRFVCLHLHATWGAMHAAESISQSNAPAFKTSSAAKLTSLSLIRAYVRTPGGIQSRGGEQL